MIDLGMNVQAAGDAARFHHSQTPDRVDLESKLYALVGAAAEGDGLQRARVPGNDDVFGGYQAILFQRRAGAAAAAEWHDAGRSAGERRLPRRLGLPQGRPGGRLVAAPWEGGGWPDSDPPPPSYAPRLTSAWSRRSHCVDGEDT